LDTEISEKGYFGRGTWKTSYSVAVNFHQLETAKTSNPVASKNG